MIFEILVLLGLFSVVIALLVERHFMLKQHITEKDKLLEELSRATKAVISKNANEYVMTTSIDKVAPEEKAPVESDLIPEESLNDDEFMQAINRDIKAPDS